MNATSKAIWILGILSTFLVILITGQTNIRNFEKVQSSIEEIYKDRLVVKGIIFDLSSALHRKEVAFLSNDTNFFLSTNESINTQIKEDIRAFRATRLTRDEKGTLDRFEKEIAALQASEKKMGLSDRTSLKKEEIKNLTDQLVGLNEDLKTLAKIQLIEGKVKLSASERAVDSMHVFESAEKYILIIFGVLMFAIIFIVPGPKKDHGKIQL